MKADLYTKFILTIIAFCLVILTLRNVDLVSKAYASEEKKYDGLGVKNYGFVPLNDDGSITVKLSSSDKIDVNIVGVSTFDELDVNIDEIGGGQIYRDAPIPVKIVGGN